MCLAALGSLCSLSIRLHLSQEIWQTKRQQPRRVDGKGSASSGWQQCLRTGFPKPPCPWAIRPQDSHWLSWGCPTACGASPASPQPSLQGRAGAHLPFPGTLQVLPASQENTGRTQHEFTTNIGSGLLSEVRKRFPCGFDCSALLAWLRSGAELPMELIKHDVCLGCRRARDVQDIPTHLQGSSAPGKAPRLRT